MHAVRFAEYGDPSVLTVVETDKPVPGTGQVRVAVRAAGVNPFDAKVRSGAMRLGTLPRGLGAEVAGVVDALGEGVLDVAVGDAVAGWAVEGGYAECALMEVYAVKPEELDWAQAAALPVAGEAASRALRELAPRKGETLLVHGASGTVGAIATQLAIADGVSVIGTAGEANLDRVRELGAVPVVYGAGLADRVREVAPRGVDAVLDTAGHGALPDAIALRGGTTERIVTLADDAAGELGVRFSSGGQGARTPEVLRTLLDAQAHGRIVLPEPRLMSLANAAHAHAELESRGSGKIVLIP
ncbi:NADP-dependent oxidoreductase [Nocardiopsis sp. N85]|uniref:NADP-dependent oxidoreductase n=1 Tax=Nocardiopsis sp. N85 TaxID=3029400 RepID=UPI00237F5884|nr:NADP-dependent oxidoreductase [Nocardiopsis sp. N85]MDE3722173.1 NADP-dependent oxidoreductase [Nocardiopsis sp. N85]